MTPRARLASLSASLLLAACSVDDVVAVQRGLDANVPRDAPVDARLPSYCEGEGPPVLVSDRGLPLCSGGLAEATFRFALCTCEGWVSAAPITTDSFASADGPYSSDRAGRAGSIGSNGRIEFNAGADVSGALWTLGGVHSSVDLRVGSDLRSGAAVTCDNGLDVGRDAYVDVSLRARTLRVGGTLTMPEGAPLETTFPPTLGMERRVPVATPPPCSCAPGDLLDVAALVAAHATDNDDALVDFDPRELDGYTGDTTLTLPCGRLYLERVAGEGDLTLVVTGRTALFIAGDLSFNGEFTVLLEGPGAEIDMFVAGDLGAMRVLRIGDALRPAQARLYVGGAGNVSLSDNGFFGGNLYAPRAELVAAGELEVYGSAFVRRVSASGPVTLHYDTSVLRAADPCPPPTRPECTSCLDCRNQACVGGTCGACVVDTDCCAPLLCASGTCVPEPF
ncbi:DUF7305 domain-containing protein [Sandaracinus amylolyticus]|uniref:Putative lipoprotein n=1 Tax=Sandaracinus amylolyticus TaxID=927083 RepID=A0A0F6W0U1_9BACT|nr:hypothetical protein [Sandaracinus amylolyticus]AKF04612.1 putative lipoprotein [Sandaracinus amylolyticus]